MAGVQPENNFAKKVLEFEVTIPTQTSTNQTITYKFPQGGIPAKKYEPLIAVFEYAESVLPTPPSNGQLVAQYQYLAQHANAGSFMYFCGGWNYYQTSGGTFDFNTDRPNIYKKLWIDALNYSMASVVVGSSTGIAVPAGKWHITIYTLPMLTWEA